MRVVGQKRLRSKLIELLNKDTLPRTMILVGPTGQGKRTIVKWLAEQMEAPLYEPEDLKIDSIRAMNEDSRTLHSTKLYLLADAEGLTMQAQNALLKLSEEPPEHAYIILTVRDATSLLPTILSRSVQMRMDGYSLEELESFADEDEKELMLIAQNPGTIKRLYRMDYEGILNHSRKVVENIGLISVSNAFNILKSVEKEEYDIFLQMLIYAYGERLKNGFKCNQQLQVLFETKNMLERSKSINKQNALEMMFVRLREVARHEVQ